MIQALEFLNELADRLGKPQFKTIEDPNPIAEHRKLIRLLNTLLQQVGSYNDWPLLRAEGSMVLVAALETDPDPDGDPDTDDGEWVTATQNSDLVTVVGQSFTETFVARGFKVSGDSETFRIKAVKSPTQLQLDRAWVQDSIVAATDKRTATIAMDRYALPSDFGREIDDFQNFFGTSNVQHVTPNEFRNIRRSDNRMRLGDPEIYTKFGMTDNQAAQMIHFHPWPKTARILRYEYQQQHPVINSDQDNILYPLTYREALLDILLHVANRDYEDSAKAQEVLQDAIRSHNLQQSNPGLTDSKARFEPSGETRMSIRRGAIDGSMNVDWGDTFDTGRKSLYGR